MGSAWDEEAKSVVKTGTIEQDVGRKEWHHRAGFHLSVSETQTLVVSE